MRVGVLGHLLNFSPGFRQAGVSRYIEFLLKELPAVSYDVDLTAYAASGVVSAADRQTFPPAIEWSLTKLPTEKPPVRIAWEQFAGPLQLTRDRIDVVHAPVNVAPILAGRPSVVTVHDLAFLVYPEQYPGIKQRYLAKLTQHSVRRAARVIAVSESTKRDILRFYGVHPDRVVVVPNGVESWMAPVEEPDEMAVFRRNQNVPEQFILFLGTLQPRKNLITLLRAWSGLEQETRLPLVVVGAEGWFYEEIFEEARRLGIAGDVFFAGYADASLLPLWYSAATMLVYPSLYEGFGLPVLEAMACGTPVIASDQSSLPELVGEAGILVAPTDVDALRSAIQRLTDDAALRSQLRASGLARAREFSWRRTARETLSVYRNALEDSDRTAG